MGRYWAEGEITPDIEDEALLNSGALKHFTPYGVADADAEGVMEDDNPTMKQLAMQQTLDEMTVAQLKTYAAEHGVDLPARATKAEILELLK